MKKLIIFTCLLAIAAFVSCRGGGAGGAGSEVSGGSDIVATVGGEAITVSTLRDAAKSQLQGIEMKIYQIKKRVLNDLIEQKLIETAAKEEGLSPDEYLEKMIGRKVTEPTDDEIKAVYEASKGKNTQPLNKVRDQIAGYLRQNQIKKLRSDLIAKLRAEKEVRLFMDAPRVEIDIKGAPSTGPKRAKVTLVEFSDYQCPFSGRARSTVMQLLDNYKDKIRYVYRDFPLSFHRESQKAHEAAHCAGDQGKYFEYSRKLFANQKKLSIKHLKSYAKELGLNSKKFNKCLDSGEHADDVKHSIEVGSLAGVSGTPAFFINGIPLTGAQPMVAFTEIIESELQR